jgi:hypothetical protein
LTKAKKHWCTSAKVVRNERDMKRAFLNQSTTCRRVVATEERSNPASRFKDMLWGVAPQCIVSIGVKMVFVYDITGLVNFLVDPIVQYRVQCALRS